MLIDREQSEQRDVCRFLVQPVDWGCVLVRDLAVQSGRNVKLTRLLEEN